MRKKAPRDVGGTSHDTTFQAPAAVSGEASSVQKPSDIAKKPAVVLKTGDTSAIKKCGVCTKTVYPNDQQINLDGSIFHKSCAKCEDCKCQITLSNFTKNGAASLLCKTHYFKRFHEEGSYVGGDKYEHKAPRDGGVQVDMTFTGGIQAASASSTSSVTKLGVSVRNASLESIPVSVEEVEVIEVAAVSSDQPADVATDSTDETADAPVAVTEISALETSAVDSSQDDYVIVTPVCNDDAVVASMDNTNESVVVENTNEFENLPVENQFHEQEEVADPAAVTAAVVEEEDFAGV